MSGPLKLTHFAGSNNDDKTSMLLVHADPSGGITFSDLYKACFVRIDLETVQCRLMNNSTRAVCCTVLKDQTGSGLTNFRAHMWSMHPAFLCKQDLNLFASRKTSSSAASSAAILPEDGAKQQSLIPTLFRRAPTSSEKAKKRLAESLARLCLTTNIAPSCAGGI